MAEEKGGTSFWKVFFGVLAALVVAASCAVGGCVLLLGGAAMKVTQEREAYRSSMHVTLRGLEREGNYVYVRGAVTNTGNQTVRYWRLDAKFKSSAGSVLDTAYTNSLERLGPSETKRFEIMHPADRRFTDVDAEITEVQLEP